MSLPTFEQMLSSRLHIGHLTSKWHPRFKNFVLTDKNDRHIIDLKKTQEQLQEASKVMQNIVQKGGKILFVGTKKQARENPQEPEETPEKKEEIRPKNKSTQEVAKPQEKKKEEKPTDTKTIKTPEKERKKEEETTEKKEVKASADTKAIKTPEKGTKKEEETTEKKEVKASADTKEVTTSDKEASSSTTQKTKEAK